jgi:hypothetical protein
MIYVYDLMCHFSFFLNKGFSVEYLNSERKKPVDKDVTDIS